MKKIILKIGGMSCSACSSSLEKYLNKQKGIINATVNLVLAQAFIEYEDSLNVKELERFIKESGFVSLGVFNEIEKEAKQKNKFVNLIIFSVLSILLMFFSMSHMININLINIEKYRI